MFTLSVLLESIGSFNPNMLVFKIPSVLIIIILAYLTYMTLRACTAQMFTEQHIKKTFCGSCNYDVIYSVFMCSYNHLRQTSLQNYLTLSSTLQPLEAIQFKHCITFALCLKHGKTHQLSQDDEIHSILIHSILIWSESHHLGTTSEFCHILSIEEMADVYAIRILKLH